MPVSRPPGFGPPPLKTYPLPPARPVPIGARPRPLAELGKGCCRWVLDDPGSGLMDQALYCAAPTEAKAGYCPEHSPRIFLALSRKARSASKARP